MTLSPCSYRPALLVAAALASAGVLSACGSSGTGAAKVAATPTTSAPATGSRQFPGAFGLVAADSPGSVEVQNPTSGQTTVTYSSSTTFTQVASVPASAVSVGVCVTAIPATGTTQSSTQPSVRPTGPQTITAASVSISQPVNGSCSRGFGNGVRPSGRPSVRPSGAPSFSPGAGRGRGGFGAVVSGQVTSVAGDAIAVRAVARQSGSAVTDMVDVTPSTTYSETVPASSSALKVGVCVQATGTADSTGAIAAKRIGISPAVNGSCTTGFGGRRGAAGAGGAGASA